MGILVERELRRPQKSLFDDMLLDEDKLNEKDDSSVKQAAELFLRVNALFPITSARNGSRASLR